MLSKLRGVLAQFVDDNYFDIITMAQKRGLKRIQRPRNGIQFVVDADTRKELQPLVFFDAGTFTRDDDGFTIGMHPHSGIGIVTYFHGTDLHHKDSGHNDGIIYDGGVQWIRSGGGVWHEEAYRRKHNSPGGTWTGSIHQLWIQLPPDVEESAVEYANLSREDLPTVDNVRVLIGAYKGVRGAIDVPIAMTYLDVSLAPGATWSLDTPSGQTTGFVYARKGALSIHGAGLGNELMGVLEHNAGAIEITAASSAAEFVVILAEPSVWPIVSAGGQIHTHAAALERSAQRIRSLAQSL